MAPGRKPEHKPDHCSDPENNKAHPEGLTHPQLGTTGGASVSSQTGGGGSESGGAQFGTSGSTATAPQTGAGASETGDGQLGANKPPISRNGESHNKERRVPAPRRRRN
jgi:hypothetical protein